MLEVTPEPRQSALPASPSTSQIPNIRAAITLYESGKLDRSKALIVGGEVVSNEEALKAALPVWSKFSAMSSLSAQVAS